MSTKQINMAKRFSSLTQVKKIEFIQSLTRARIDFTALPIMPDSDNIDCPLSYGQHSLWLTWLMNPDSPAYNMSGILSIQGSLDVDVLAQSLLALTERHSALRTQFVMSDKQADPRQQIQPLLQTLGWQQVDISSLSAERREVACQLKIEAFTSTPFDLSHDNAFRVLLIRLADEFYQLVLSMHHINVDGFSVPVLIRDTVEFYQAAVEGRAPMLPTLPISFADFALWQRTWLDAGEKQRQLEYWKQQLGSENSVLTLPTRKPRSTVSGNQQANHLFSFDKTLSDKLRICAKRNNASVFIVLQAVFSLVLFRYSGMKNIRMGMPVVNRRRAETHNLVGYLTNVQVLSTLIDPRQTFEQLLAQVRDNVLDGQAYQDVPFDMLVEALQPQRQAGVNPLFQVKITEQAAISKVYKFAGLTMTLKGSETSLAHFDLSFDFTDRGDSITGCMAYIAELYDSTLIERLCTSFTCYLRQLLDAADTPLGSTLHDLQSSVVIRKQTFEQGDTFLNIWSHVLSSNEQQCAVVQGTFNLTYGELDTYAGKLAEKLKNSGVTRGVPVGVYANRSPEFVIAMLAVLKAGGAYVPLDPQLPDDRLQWQLQDSGAQLLLAAQPPAWIVAIPQRDISLESLTQASIGDDEVFIEPLIHPEQAAYIIYTSGSTGRPKGVVISHHSLSNYIQALLAELNLSKAVHSMAMVSTVAADLGHSMLFGALSCGKTLHLINHDTAMDPAAFADYMQSHQIDVLKLVPSHMRALLQAGQAEQVLPRHTLIMGGEALTWSLLQEIQTAHPQCRVINHYGPTEATVGVLTQNTARADSSALTVPVGSPLANVSACIMDISFSPVPIGVSGELYLGGAGIARGYLSQPVLTAERFVPDPFISGARLYRTGDKARQRDDGSIEFLGRVDDQVKIRGYRVELSEITTHIMAQEGVQQAEVIAHQTEDERTVLYGYVVVEKNHSHDFDSSELLKNLARQLPDYMLPSAITALDVIPVTANGKVDRKSLPLPDQQGTSEFEAPEGEVEIALATIWEEVLKVNGVGRHDSFFDLGGDSILSLKMISKARKCAAIPKIKLGELTKFPTIAKLSCKEGQHNGLSPLLLLNAASSNVPNLFCVHGVFGTVFDYKKMANALQGRYLVWGLQSRMLLEPQWTDSSLQQMAEDYVQCIRQQQPQGPYHLLGWSLGGALAVMMTDILKRQEQEVDYLGLVDSFVPKVFTDQMITDLQQAQAQNLSYFIRVVFPNIVQPGGLPRFLIDALKAGSILKKVQVQNVFQQILDAGQDKVEGYAVLGAEELSHLFMVGWHTKQLSVQIDMLPAIAVQPYCWWIEGREKEKFCLEQQLGKTFAHERPLGDNHFTILDREDFIETLEMSLQNKKLK